MKGIGTCGWALSLHKLTHQVKTLTSYLRLILSVAPFRQAASSQAARNTPRTSYMACYAQGNGPPVPGRHFEVIETRSTLGVHDVILHEPRNYSIKISIQHIFNKILSDLSD